MAIVMIISIGIRVDIGIIVLFFPLFLLRVLRVRVVLRFRFLAPSFVLFSFLLSSFGLYRPFLEAVLPVKGRDELRLHLRPVTGPLGS